jgi:hypothetical protein
LGRKEIREQFWIILKEGSFYVLGSRGDGESEKSECGDKE